MIHHYLVAECGLNPAQVAIQLKGWEIIPWMDGDVKVGEAMIKGSEIHIALSQTYRKKVFIKRKSIQSAIKSLLDEKKFLVTRSFKGDKTEPFLRRIGFVKTHSDQRFNFWWLDRLPLTGE